MDAALDAGREQDEIQVWELASIEALAGFPDGVVAQGGFPAWQAGPGGFLDAAAAQDESLALLLDAAE